MITNNKTKIFALNDFPPKKVIFVWKIAKMFASSLLRRVLSIESATHFAAARTALLFSDKGTNFNQQDPEIILSRLDHVKKENPTLESVDTLRALAFLRKNDPFSARQAILEELRHHPKNIEAQDLARNLRASLFLNRSQDDNDNDATTQNNFANSLFSLSRDMKHNEPEFAMCFEALLDHSMLDAGRLFTLFDGARNAFSQEEEDDKNENENLIVECGTAGGGSLVMMGCGGAVMQKGNAKFKLVSFDTFQGMPKPNSSSSVIVDRISNNGNGKETSAQESHWADGTCCSGGEETVKRLARTFGFDNVETVPGLFSETLPKYFETKEKQQQIKMLHIDCDWYESTRDCLTHLWPKLAKGGRFQIDDYLYWEGCRKAVDEYFATLPNPPEFKFSGVALFGVKK